MRRVVLEAPAFELCPAVPRSVRTLSTHILQQYLEVDSELYAACATEWEARKVPAAVVMKGVTGTTNGGMQGAAHKPAR